MSYCALTDLVERFSEEELLRIAPDPADDLGETIDQAAVARACEDAAGEIDGYVSAGGYTTPLAPVPRIIAAYACDIARYRLYDDAATEQVTRRYDDAVRFLKLVASRTVSLGITPTPPAVSAGAAQFDTGRRSFSGGGY